MPSHFRLSISHTATVTLTMCAYVDVRCPSCQRLVFQMPGTAPIVARVAHHRADQQGRGPVAKCERCGALVEAVGVRAA